MGLWDWITGKDDGVNVQNVSSPEQKQILEAMMPLLLRMFQNAGQPQNYQQPMYPNYNSYKVPQRPPRTVNKSPMSMQQARNRALVNMFRRPNMTRRMG